MPEHQTAFDFLKKEATVNDHGVSHVTQKNYMDFMAAHGVTKEVIDATTEAHQELINGMYHYVGDRLKERIPEVKKAGEDPMRAKEKIVVNIPNGSISMEMTAAKTFPVPNQDHKVTKTAVTTLQINQQRLMDKNLCADMEASIKKDLGL